MIEIKFYKVGTIVYSILSNKIIAMEVVDVIINGKELDISYKLRVKNTSSKQYTMHSSLIFESLKHLKKASGLYAVQKEEINKQFDKLTPKEIEKCTTDTEDKKE